MRDALFLYMKWMGGLDLAVVFSLADSGRRGEGQERLRMKEILQSHMSLKKEK